MPSQTTLFLSLLFSSIGFGYFIYGKRQALLVPLLCGVALMAYSWFVTGTLLTLAIGVVLMVIPYFVRH